MKSILGPVSLVALASLLAFTNASPTPVQIESQMEMEMAMAFSDASEQVCLKMVMQTPPPCWKLPPQNKWVCLFQSMDSLLSSC
jgi:hypothetical protein